MMKHNRILYFCTAVLSLIFCACADDDSSFRGEPVAGSEKEINLRASINQVNLSRANDSGFADGDRIGVYAVNFGESGTPGSLTADDNLASNVGFTFDEENYKWNGDRMLYFVDDKTAVDFYGYYPYAKEIENVNAYPFSVERNQSAEISGSRLSAYEASDFLWAKTPAVLPSSPSVSLTFRHILASVQVTLIEGNGFESGEWAGLDKSVIVSNTGRNATIDLATGKVTLAGNAGLDGIVAKPYKDNYRAIVVPQTVDAGKTVLAITVDGHTYNFKKEVEMAYLQGKLHKFSIQVSKKEASGDFEFSLLGEAVTAWESDLVSHNGEAKEYIIVDVPEEGGLEKAVLAGKLDPAEIINLKITGSMNETDFEYIRKTMGKLEAINLSEVDIDKLPDYAFFRMFTLKTCVFPRKLKRIGYVAFYGTGLTGSLDIPEGVTHIDNRAFSNYFNESTGDSTIPGGQITTHNNLTGTLNLPSTLKYIGGEAFHGCDFSGTLLLPEGIEYIGGGAFAGCKYFTGDLHLPESIQEIGSEAFMGMTGIKGWIICPPDLKSVVAFGDMNVTGIQWPDNPVEIGSFEGFCCKNDLKIPESVQKIGGYCFFQSRIKHIELPPDISVIPEDCFRQCSELRDTIVIPDNVEVISSMAFMECPQIEALVFPAKLQRIEDMAFQDCFSLSYIYCQAVEPPVLVESAFNGVAKDNFTVEVPEESVDAYRNAPGWKEFKRISSYRNFVARPSKYNVLNKGGKREIILNADADWEMTECPDWCRIDKTSGSKKTVITLTVNEMPHDQGNRTGIISFRLKDSEEHVTHINVGQYDYEHEEDGYLQLQQATKGEGIDLFFCGDGYDAIDISSGLYLEDMKQEMEYFFAVEPYTTYRDYFNVYTSIALSEDSGVESINRWRNTKFHICLGDGFTTRLSADWEAAMDYCAATVPPIVNRPDPKVGVILLGNTELYEGLTYSIGDSFCAVVTKSEDYYPYDARGIVQHEAGGHGVGWLADEYIYHWNFLQRCCCSCCGHADEVKANHAVGFGLNVSLEGKYKSVAWSHLIFNKNYGDIVDIYEGGYFHSRGVYRSEYNSCMNNNIPYFSTWSRQLIVQRIMHLAGETFDFDSFIANDKRTMGRDFTGFGRGTENVSAPARHGNPPIRITNYKFGKKGGKR